MNAVAQLFMDYASPQAFVERLNFSPDEWQMEALSSDSQRLIMACGRQTGKSTTTALLTYRTATVIPGSLSLILAPCYRQSKELALKIHELVWRDNAQQITSMNKEEICFKNKSRIVALPGEGEKIRSFSGVALLVIDEAAYVPDSLYHAAAPMISTSHGRMVLLSSPGGKQGFFWNIWNRGIGWDRFNISTEECSRADQEFLREEKRITPAHIYRREYQAEFTEGVGALVSYDDLQAAKENNVRPLVGKTLVVDEYDPLPKVEALSG